MSWLDHDDAGSAFCGELEGQFGSEEKCMRSDISGIVVAYTEKAILLRVDDDLERWVPRSQLEEDFTDAYLESAKDSEVEIDLTIPEWLYDKITGGE